MPAAKRIKRTARRKRWNRGAIARLAVGPFFFGNSGENDKKNY
jgi:hypothetical protein